MPIFDSQKNSQSIPAERKRRVIRKKRFASSLLMTGSIGLALVIFTHTFLSSSAMAFQEKEVSADRFTLTENESVVVAGNTFGVRLAYSGYLEAMIQAAHPGKNIQVRQPVWDGDEVDSAPRETSVPTTDHYLKKHKADTLILFYGMNESFWGKDKIASFKEKLSKLIKDHQSKKYNGKSAPRIVLVSPIGHELIDLPIANATHVKARNQMISAYAKAMKEVADENGVRFVDLFSVSQKLFDENKRELTSNGIHPNEFGCFHFARQIAQSFGWLDKGFKVEEVSKKEVLPLRQICYDKHYHFRLLYRPTNTEYVWGRRAKPFGVVNFPPEMDQLRRMIDRRQNEVHALAKETSIEKLFQYPPGEVAIWEKVANSKVFDEDKWTPEKVELKSIGGSLGNVAIASPEEMLKTLTVPDGYEISCWASEKDFKELRNPLAMSFDSKGRLWVTCTPTYPHLLPGENPRCQILILEDTDNDGKADKRTVWADQLYIPTGFAIGTDGVYVGQAPELWKYVDTDGDNKADRRYLVASGFGMCDSHHTISAFEWEPNGGFLMHEGVFIRSAVETPYGLLRTFDAGVWRVDPRTERLEVIAHTKQWNPWGHVFSDFGQSILADASDGHNYNFAGLLSNYDFPNKAGRPPLMLRRGRPVSGNEIITGRHFPEEVLGTYLVNQCIGFHGTRWDKLTRAGSTWKTKSEPKDLVTGSDLNFRPVAIEQGPDGAIYIVDWSNPLIGHMQYSVRDPRRDVNHGRVWRVKHKTRPLVPEVDIEGASVEQLLEMLRLPEANTRQLARRRLQSLPYAEVADKVALWKSKLKNTDPLFDRMVVESLWYHQAHGKINLTLLDEVCGLTNPLARAAGGRVLRHWLEGRQVSDSDAMVRLAKFCVDDHPAVRLEGIVGCGFVGNADAAAIAATASTKKMDNTLNVALTEAIKVLKKYGEPKSDIVKRIALWSLPAEELLKSAEKEEVIDLWRSIVLTRSDIDLAKRTEVFKEAEKSLKESPEVYLCRIQGESLHKSAALTSISPFLVEAKSDSLKEIGTYISAWEQSKDPVQKSFALALRFRSGVSLSDIASKNAHLLPAILKWLPAGSVAEDQISVVKELLDSGAPVSKVGVYFPNDAVEQLVRHNKDPETLRSWLKKQVDKVDGNSFANWNRQMIVSMASLKGLNQLGSAPKELSNYRVALADSKVYELGRKLYHAHETGCAKCHGENGEGTEGFPALALSPWVLGDAKRSASIVVHGLTGPLHMPSGQTFNSAMAPLGENFDDEEIAAMLTYVRQTWGNFAEPVSANEVASVRPNAPVSVLWKTLPLSRTYPLETERLLPEAAKAERKVAAKASDPTGAPGISMAVQALVVFLVPVIFAVILFVGIAMSKKKKS